MKKIKLKKSKTEKFPDMSGDGKVTKKDVLIAKGVLPKKTASSGVKTPETSISIQSGNCGNSFRLSKRFLMDFSNNSNLFSICTQEESDKITP